MVAVLELTAFVRMREGCDTVTSAGAKPGLTVVWVQCYDSARLDCNDASVHGLEIQEEWARQQEARGSF